jgi:hypothetical protein
VSPAQFHVICTTKLARNFCRYEAHAHRGAQLPSDTVMMRETHPGLSCRGVKLMLRRPFMGALIDRLLAIGSAGLEGVRFALAGSEPSSTLGI